MRRVFKIKSFILQFLRIILNVKSLSAFLREVKRFNAWFDSSAYAHCRYNSHFMDTHAVNREIYCYIWIQQHSTIL